VTTQFTLDQCSVTDHIDHLPQPTEPDNTCILKRRHPYEYADRIVWWYAPFTGEIIMPDSKYQQIAKDTTLESLLDALKAYAQRKGKKSATLFLIAGTKSHTRPKEWWFEVTHEWRQSTFFTKYLTGTYESNGFTVHLRSSGGFFGEEVRDIKGIYNAWHTLEIMLQDAFHAPGCNILADTPAQTGRELLIITLPAGVEYPRVHNDIRELLKHNIPQGRLTTLPPAQPILADGAHVIDGKWFYASCVSHLPVGPSYMDTVNKFLGIVRKDGRLAPRYPAFYNVTVTVPDSWHHIGLLKENIKTDGEASFPNEPGYTFTNWAEAHEVALLLDTPQSISWHVHINERIYWPYTDKIADPFKTLRTKLVELRENSTSEYHKNALRAILLHLIGCFHRLGTEENFYTPYSRLPLTEKPYKVSAAPGGVNWSILRPYESKDRNAFIHPEWSSTVYGRARAKIADFVLRLPYEDVICLRNDAVWSASSLELGDPNRPGSFREKGIIPGPFRWPRNSGETYQYARKYNLGLDEIANNDEEEDE